MEKRYKVSEFNGRMFWHRDFAHLSQETEGRLVAKIADDISRKRIDGVSALDLLASQAKQQIERTIRRAYVHLPEFDTEFALVYEVDSEESVKEIICGFKVGCTCAGFPPTIEIVGVEIPETREVEEQYEIPLQERIKGLLRLHYVERTATRKVPKEITGKYIVFSDQAALENFMQDLPHGRMTWRDQLMPSIPRGNLGGVSFIGISTDEVMRYAQGQGRNILYDLFLNGEIIAHHGDKLADIVRKAEEKVSLIRDKELQYQVGIIPPNAYSISSIN